MGRFQRFVTMEGKIMKSLLAVLICLSALPAFAQDYNWPQWRGPDRDGLYKKMRSRDLRGGGDGKTFGSSDSSGYSTSGEACVKYLGGPMRSYTGKAMESTMLEVVIRPPTTTLEDDMRATGTLDQLEWDSVGRILTKAKQKSEDSEEEDDDDDEFVAAQPSPPPLRSRRTGGRRATLGMSPVHALHTI